MIPLAGRGSRREAGALRELPSRVEVSERLGFSFHLASICRTASSLSSLCLLSLLPVTDSDKLITVRRTRQKKTKQGGSVPAVIDEWKDR